MSSKFVKSFVCFNGPCEGRYIDAAVGAKISDACAIRWSKANGSKGYAVYLLVEHQGREGLMFLKSYDRPQDAQEKVQELALVTRALQEQANENGPPPDGMMEDLLEVKPLVLTGNRLS